MHIIHEKTDPAKVSEIKRQFLAESRIHYQQYVFKLKEKVQNLSHERQMLQNQLQDLKFELSDLQDKNGELL